MLSNVLTAKAISRALLSSYLTRNGVAMIFFWGGQFSVISGVRPDSVGGGEVVAEIFRLRP